MKEQKVIGRYGEQIYKQASENTVREDLAELTDLTERADIIFIEKRT